MDLIANAGCMRAFKQALKLNLVLKSHGAQACMAKAPLAFNNANSQLRTYTRKRWRAFEARLWCVYNPTSAPEGGRFRGLGSRRC